MSQPENRFMTKEQRDALPSSSFAIPSRRLIPIHDVSHIKMAWNAVDRIAACSDDERYTARRSIIRAAKEKGVDISRWNQETIEMQGMSLVFPETPNHPNKVPFSGVLTRLDEPSTKPLSGTGGRKVILPSEVALEALASLLGMAIDFTPDLDGHDPTRKIGLITSADIVGNAIQISGFFYAADFPEEVERIQADKDDLGFSFEAQSLMQSMKADPLVVVACEFTGAAVLYKDKAAYYDTSIAASADGENEMTKEQEAQLNALTTGLAGIMKSMEGFGATIAAQVDAAVSKAANKIEAASIAPMVVTHCAGLRDVASKMAAAGIGMAGTRGHVAVLNKMADDMEVEATMGRIPHVYRDHDYLTYAGADKNKEEQEKIKTEAAAAQKTLTESLLKPMIDAVAALGTQFADLKVQVTASAGSEASAQRKTLSPAMMMTLERMGLSAAGGEDGKGKIKVRDFDEAAKKAGIQGSQSIAIKLTLREAGLLEGNA